MNTENVTTDNGDLPIYGVINRLLFIPYIIIKAWIICLSTIITLPLLILFDIDIIEPIDKWTDKYSPI